MKTKYLYYEDHSNKKAATEAADLINKGEIVAFPTETVYGLGADATNDEAVQKIYHAKGRPSDNPLIVHVASKTQLDDLVQPYPEYVDRLIDAFSPGPITYILPEAGRVAEKVTAGLQTIGVRIPSHPAAQALLKKCHCPVAAPSANLSGKPSPTTAQHVKEDMDGKIAAILDGGAANVGVESTVIDCTGNHPVILRIGGITAEDIGEIIEVQTDQAENIIKPKSPGTKYMHYMPEIPLILVNDATQLQKVIYTEQQKGKRVGALVTNLTARTITADKVYQYGQSEQELARNLYDYLRMMHKKDVDVVIAERITANNVGSAVMDRLSRAATKIM